METVFSGGCKEKNAVCSAKLIVDNGYLLSVGTCVDPNVIIPKSVNTIGQKAFFRCLFLSSIVISCNIKKVSFGAFDECYNLFSVFYEGSKSDWKKLDIEYLNTPLMSAKRYYYSEKKPKIDGDFWHYVDGKPTIWQTV